MIEITFNLPQDSERRSKASNITLKEETRAVLLIKEAIIAERQCIGEHDDEDHQLIQKFIDNYLNLLHHKDTTCGLWAMDKQPSEVAIEVLVDLGAENDIIEKLKEYEFQIKF